MDPGFSEPRGEEGRAAGGNRAPCFTPRPICSRFSPSPICIQESEPVWENGKKIPSGFIRENPGSAEPLPFIPGKCSQFRSAREGEKTRRKIRLLPGNSGFSCFSSSRGIFGMPRFLSRRDFCSPGVFRALRFGAAPKPFQLQPFPKETAEKSSAVGIGDRELSSA